jgi:hypothetical protein
MWKRGRWSMRRWCFGSSTDDVLTVLSIDLLAKELDDIEIERHIWIAFIEMTESMIECLNLWLNAWIYDWMLESMIECLNLWLNAWIYDWMLESMIECLKMKCDAWIYWSTERLIGWRVHMNCMTLRDGSMIRKTRNNWDLNVTCCVRLLLHSEDETFWTFSMGWA